MGYEFLIFIVVVSILQTSLCTINIEAPRRGRQNRFPQYQSEENALDYNGRDGESAPNSDMESLKNQLNSLSPQQLQQIISMLSPERALGPQANDNDVDEMKNEIHGNVLTNDRNRKRPNNNRRGGRRNGRGRRDGRGRNGCNNNRGRCGGNGMGYGMGRGEGNGQGYGAGMGYGSGGGNGEGFGMGQGYGGAGNGMGAGMGGAGTGLAPNQGYEPRTGRGRGYGMGRGSGGAGGNIPGFGTGGGYRDPYDYDDSPSSPGISGTQGAMIGGGSEISGVKINSLARRL